MLRLRLPRAVEGAANQPPVEPKRAEGAPSDGTDLLYDPEIDLFEIEDCDYLERWVNSLSGMW